MLDTDQRTTAARDPGAVSHWLRQLHPTPEEPLVLRQPLEASIEADVCIVGAGYTGLWTAYHLIRADPSLKIVILESEFAGYGASGRNGGAVIAQFQGSREYWTKRCGGREGAVAMENAIQRTVHEIGEVVQREGIDCSYSLNGVVMVARTPLEVEHFKHQVERDRQWGLGEEDSRYLTADEVGERISIAGALGARFSPHCASIQPAALARDLADVVERGGVTIFEGTRVRSIEPRAVRTDTGHTVRARTILRATEAYTESLESDSRAIVPIHTSMLATEVIPDQTWREIGWERREALLAEHSFLHLQHTADHRITIGGDDPRIPYRYGSAPAPDGPPSERVQRHYRDELARLFPALEGVGIAQAWQGIFGTNRRWAPVVGIDRKTGLAWAGSFVGEGVAASYLASSTVADLILDRDTERTRLPLVGEQPRRWEPEPLRWIGSAGIMAMRQLGDRMERRTNKPSRLWRLGDRISGYTGRLG